MKGTVRKLEKLWVITSIGCLLMFVLSQPFYKLWVGTDVNVSYSLSLAVAIYFIVTNLGNTYMYVINGIGTIRLQLVTYAAFAIFAWPLMVWASNNFGIVGIIMIPSVVMVVQAALGKIQLRRLINNTAYGIWAQ